jgi:transcription elongation factor GreA
LEYVYLTEDGLSKMKDELSELKYAKRPVLSQKIATARELGDLKENAEYHAAREELSLLETKIYQLQDKINRARIIDNSDISTDQVAILTTVQIKDLKSNKTYKYSLVSEDEADYKLNKISISSPVGKGLLGMKVGDITEITVPAGLLRYEILSIKGSET